MDKITIAVVSSDRDYGKALSMSLLAACGDVAIRVFDSREFIGEWSLYKGRGAYYDCFDIVLWAGDEVKGAYGGNIVYLTDKVSSVRSDYGEKKFSLYKYTSAQNLMSYVFEIYSFLTGRKAVYVKKKNVQLYGFASWEGGAGCTTLAMALAQEMLRFKGKKVLYFSMEDVESSSVFFDYLPGHKSTGEYLYRLLNEEKSSVSDGMEIPFLDSYVVKDVHEIETFPPSNGKNPLRELTETEIQRFIVSLMDSSRYDTIIMDISGCLTDAGIGALKMADRICFVTRSRQVTGREEQYLKHVLCCAGEKVIDRALKILNDVKPGKEPSAGKIDECGEETWLERSMIVRSMEYGITENGKKEILLEKHFGADIKSLAAELMGENSTEQVYNVI